MKTVNQNNHKRLQLQKEGTIVQWKNVCFRVQPNPNGTMELFNLGWMNEGDNLDNWYTIMGHDDDGILVDPIFVNFSADQDRWIEIKYDDLELI